MAKQIGGQIWGRLYANGSGHEIESDAAERRRYTEAVQAVEGGRLNDIQDYLTKTVAL